MNPQFCFLNITFASLCVAIISRFMFDSKKNHHYDLIFPLIVFPAPPRAAGEEMVGVNWTDGFLQRRKPSLPLPSCSFFFFF